MQQGIRLAGKIALVTGASSGLGWRFAQVLAQAGAAVALAARSTDKLEQLKHEIEGAGGRACAVTMDVTEVASVRAAVLAAESALGDEKRAFAIGVGDVVVVRFLDLERALLFVDA